MDAVTPRHRAAPPAVDAPGERPVPATAPDPAPPARRPGRIRPAARVAVVHEGRLLLAAYRRVDGSEWYALPGGGQEPGETMAEAARREALEEAGVEVEVGPLLWVREYLPARHPDYHQENWLDDSPGVQHLQLVFLAAPVGAVPERPVPRSPDDEQLGAVWVTAAELAGLTLSPAALHRPLLDLLRHGTRPEDPYLGETL
ncbi:NUDIX domain-containing protein [Allostreptomyces psammosilenae]|uniref:8-oxo-dGTP pyrophosphatase MutT (NUDIX family) n=1 Tax=Allostreptomyces psammosilenae TaxID=1892865 RepID=A0A852ZZW7_9ACTN|nr:NUDIX domain-containing protein [Allostreptomyces psammosilenae]NYI04121.1 8-oxo-dGTP pyrophosphatase MutT (NUDIX family) [Allostreptomyces psammosilenae]